MHEDKQMICDLLCRTLQQTRNQEDLVSLTYNDTKETVVVEYQGGGGFEVNVAIDSGIAMIKDILDNL